MILGTHVALHSLARLRSSAIDVLTTLVTTDEGNSSDIGMGANVCHSLFSTLDNVDNAIGDSGLLQEVHEDLHGTWDLLRGLHDVGVTKCDGKREHPERAHSGEVEGGNTCADTERGPVAVNINTLCHILKGLPLCERAEAAGVLNDFVASEDITLGVNERFTVLLGDNLDDFVLINNIMRICS